MEILVSIETAKLTLEAGFNWDCRHYLTQDDVIHEAVYYESTPNNETLDDDWFSISEKNIKVIAAVPTQSSLQKWLREVHNIDVCINPHYKVNGGVAGYLFDVYHQFSKFKTVSGDSVIYEDSLELGLKEGLIRIPKKTEV